MVSRSAAFAHDLDVLQDASLEAVVAVGAALRCALARAKREGRPLPTQSPLSITA